MVSEEAKDLIKKMLTVDPRKRIDGVAGLRHPWLSMWKNIEIGNEKEHLDINIVNNLRAYRGVSPLKKACMNILVKMTDNKDIENLREVFMNIDKDGTGHITPKELKQAMHEANI